MMSGAYDLRSGGAVEEQTLPFGADNDLIKPKRSIPEKK